MRKPPKLVKLRVPKAPKRSAAVKLTPGLHSGIDSWAARWGCTREMAARRLLAQALAALDHANRRER